MDTTYERMFVFKNSTTLEEIQLYILSLPVGGMFRYDSSEIRYETVQGRISRLIVGGVNVPQPGTIYWNDQKEVTGQPIGVLSEFSFYPVLSGTELFMLYGGNVCVVTKASVGTVGVLSYPNQNRMTKALYTGDSVRAILFSVRIGKVELLSAPIRYKIDTANAIYEVDPIDGHTPVLVNNINVINAVLPPEYQCQYDMRIRGCPSEHTYRYVFLTDVGPTPQTFFRYVYEYTPSGFVIAS